MRIPDYGLSPPENLRLFTIFRLEELESKKVPLSQSEKALLRELAVRASQHKRRRINRLLNG